MRVRGCGSAAPEGIGDASAFNLNAIGEMIVTFDDGSMDTVFIDMFEVYLERQAIWKPMKEAFRDRDLIVDNLNTCFFEPTTPEDRKRGYTQ